MCGGGLSRVGVPDAVHHLVLERLDTSILDPGYPAGGGCEREWRPEIAIAAGVLYFTILGIFELVIAGRRGDRLLSKVDPGGPIAVGMKVTRI